MKTLLGTFLVCSALGAFQSCTKSKEKGTIIYIEIQNAEPELEKCFSEKLYDRWAGLDEKETHSAKDKYTGGKPEDKHIFKSFGEFDADKDKPGTIKIIMTSDPAGGDTTDTFFQLQKFQLEEGGIWTENLNIGHFRVQDRPNDTKNPGKIDQEEICEMMVRFAIKASFK